MKRQTILIIVGILAILALVKIFYLSDSLDTAPKGKAGPAPAVNVTGYIVHPQLLEHKIFASGTVLANEAVELRPEVSGKLVAIYFKEGSTVAKGALLAKINDADLQAQLRKLQSQQKLAKDIAQRLNGLLEIKGVSQEEYDAATSSSQTIAADIDYTRAQIAKTEIRAPFNGKIGLKQISEGGFVTNANVIAQMQQTDVLKIDFTIPERYANVIKTGDEISFTVENKQDKFTAKVMAIEPKINEQTRDFMVRALYNNAQSNIFPGTFAKIELVADQNTQSLMIPTEAVIPELKGTKVFLCKGGKAIPEKIITGMRSESMIEVVSGLKDGDTVVTTGIMSLKPEAQIHIIDLK